MIQVKQKCILQIHVELSYSASNHISRQFGDITIDVQSNDPSKCSGYSLVFYDNDVIETGMFPNSTNATELNQKQVPPLLNGKMVEFTFIDKPSSVHVEYSVGKHWKCLHLGWTGKTSLSQDTFPPKHPHSEGRTY